MDLSPKKIKVLLASLASLSAISFIIVSSAFAWFDFNKTAVNSIVAGSGNISLTSISATSYKYQYPPIADISFDSITEDDPLNYDGVGKVMSKDLTSNQVNMNKYDPFYLSLQPALSVYDLFTNFVIKLSVTFQAWSDVDFSVTANRLTDDEWNASSKSTTNDGRASDYLDFWASTADLSAVSSVSYTTPHSAEAGTQVTTTYNVSDDNGANNIIFFTMKNFEENTSNTASFFRADGSTPAKSEFPLLATTTYRYAEQTLGTDSSYTKTVNVYINIDYNTSSLASMAASLRADTTINLGMDYYFTVNAIQA
ncbi:MAG: hypothetical protein LKJ88_06720 [Bacilli bacterium]|jgi:hypothetical protein|nr:hypothetical protein [Bacilli bacterium]